MAEYICIRKCRHDRVYEEGDIAVFPDGEKVPRHFKLIKDDNAELREKAKELGIKGWHNMKPDNLEAKIAEIEAETPDEDIEE